MDIFDIATIALVVLAIFDWVAVGILWYAARPNRGRPIHSLESRGRVALLIALSSTFATALGVNRHLNLGLSGEMVALLLVVVVVLPSLGNLWFLVDLVRGEFGG